MKSKLKVAVGLGLLLSIAIIFFFGRERPATRIILITLDTLRYDSFAEAERRESDMPLTLSWASRGHNFTRFYSSTASTRPTHATMFTGLHPWQHKVVNNLTVVSDELVTVAEVLSEKEFSTDAVVASIPLHSNLGFAQGFAEYREPFTHGKTKIWGNWGEICSDCHENFYTLANNVTIQAEELLNKAPSQNRFYWFHYFDPHSPYGDTDGNEIATPYQIGDLASRGGNVQKELRRLRKLYDRDVGYLDQQLDRLLNHIYETSDGYRTLVVVTVDHGEGFGEGGSVSHGARIIPALVHVPTFILGPRVKPEIRSDVASSIDIMPTLLGFAGFESATPNGRDLMRDRSSSQDVFGMRRTYEEPWREKRMDGNSYLIDGYLFFNVDSNGYHTRGNSQMLLDPVPEEKSISLKSAFALFEESIRQFGSKPITDEDTLDKLRALGYVR